MFTTVLLAESELELQRLVDEIQGVYPRKPRLVVSRSLVGLLGRLLRGGMLACT